MGGDLAKYFGTIIVPITCDDVSWCFHESRNIFTLTSKLSVSVENTMANRDLLISEESYILPNLKNIVFFSVKTVLNRRIVSYYAAYSDEIFRIIISTYFFPNIC